MSSLVAASVPLALRTCPPCRSLASLAPRSLDVVDLPDPAPGPGQQLYEVSTAGVRYADTHHLQEPAVGVPTDAPSAGSLPSVRSDEDRFTLTITPS